MENAFAGSSESAADAKSHTRTGIFRPVTTMSVFVLPNTTMCFMFFLS